MHEVLVNRLGGLSLPRKSVVRLTDRPDMTLDVYRGRKTTIQQLDRKVKTINFRVTNGKGEMDRKTEFNAPFKYFSHIELTEGHVREQYARDQVFCMRIPSPAGLKPSTTR